jgi:hypothetical protein
LSVRARLYTYSAVLVALGAALLVRLWTTGPDDAASEVRLGRFAIGAASLLLFLRVFGRLDDLLGQPLSPEAKFFGLLAVAPALAADLGALRAGWALAALVLALVAVRWSRGGRSFPAGWLLGLAMALRTALGVVGIWLLWRRQPRTAAWALAAFTLVAVWAWVSGGGSDPSGEAPRSDELAGTAPVEWSAALGPVSLVPRRSTLGSERQDLRAGIERVAGAADAVYGIAAVVFAALLFAAALRRRPGRLATLSAQETAAALAYSACMSPSSPAGDFVFLLPAAVVGFDAWTKSCPGRSRRTAGALWLASAALSVAFGLARWGILPDWVLAPSPLALAGVVLAALVSYPGFFPRVRAGIG